MPALLYCRTGPMSGASFSLDAEATVGRTGEHAVTLSDDRISSRHARLWPDSDSGEWMLQDLESRNGTLVDGSPASEPVPLGDLSVITFAGRFDFIFQVVESSSVNAPRRRDLGDADDVRTKFGGAAPSLPDVDSPADDVRTRFGAEAPSLPDTDDAADDAMNESADGGTHTRAGGAPPGLPDVDDARTRFEGAPPGLPDVSEPAETVGPESAARPETRSVTLHIEASDPDTSEPDVSSFELRPGRNVIGRSSDCDVQIDDASLSRSHAVITVEDGRISIRDNGSKNGTYLDGEKVTGERSVSVENRLRFGFRIDAWISSDQN